MTLLTRPKGVAPALGWWRWAGLLLLVSAAQAHEPGPRVPVPALVRQECGACHLTYPVSMLPARSWQRLMRDLEHHYGSDASLSEPERQQISRWLQAHAGTFDLVQEAPPQNRITRSAWFMRRHDAQHVPPTIWRRAAVRSAANCAACHTQAAKGSYLERDVRLPPR